MNKIIKKEKILVDVTKIDKIAKAANCHKAAVYNALAYRSNSRLAGEIRTIALNRYGGIVTKVPTLIKA